MGAFDVTLTVTNNAGHNVKFRPDYITVGTNGMDNIPGQVGFTLYPNPAKNGNFTLTFSKASDYTIKVISGVGQIVDIRTESGKTAEFHLNSLGNGIYFIQVADHISGQITSKKLILQ
jgi:PKD repeat protein